MAHRHIAALALTTTLAGSGLALAQQGGGDDIDPCEGGFYLADEDRDGTITAEELEEAALAAFARFDTDGSGDVTEAEYEACANAGAGVVGVPAQRVKSNLPEYDADGDGMLSQQEFMNAAGDAYDQARIEANLEGDESAADDDRRQDADVADVEAMPDAEGTDGTTMAEGDATTEEGAALTGPQPVVVLRRFIFIPESQPEMDPVRMGREEATARAMQTFSALDADRSGRLEPHEWAKQRAVRQDMADLIRSRFAQDDVDSSGTLTPEEFVAGEERRRQQAEETLSEGGDGDASGANPPVVYYRYPHVM